MSEPRITIRAIAVMAAADFGVSIGALRSSTRTKEIVFARQAVMYLAVEQLGKTLAETGNFFGRDHSTVLHGIRRAAERIGTDAVLASRVGRIKSKIVAIEAGTLVETEVEGPVPEEIQPPPAAEDVSPARPDAMVAIPASVGALGRAVDTYLKARKRLEDDRFSPHEAPSRRNEEQALSALRVAHHDYLAGGRAS